LPGLDFLLSPADSRVSGVFVPVKSEVTALAHRLEVFWPTIQFVGFVSRPTVGLIHAEVGGGQNHKAPCFRVRLAVFGPAARIGRATLATATGPDEANVVTNFFPIVRV
jgi:hypothetical protein